MKPKPMPLEPTAAGKKTRLQTIAWSEDATFIVPVRQLRGSDMHSQLESIEYVELDIRTGRKWRYRLSWMRCNPNSRAARCAC
jgi:hypothetical protein